VSYPWDDDKATDFFEELREAAQESRAFGFTLVLAELDKLAGMAPTKTTLLKIVNLPRPHASTVEKVAEVAQGIIDGKYHQSFRFKYGGFPIGPSPRWQSDIRYVSAATCFLSEIRQAVHYGQECDK